MLVLNEPQLTTITHALTYEGVNSRVLLAMPGTGKSLAGSLLITHVLRTRRAIELGFDEKVYRHGPIHVVGAWSTRKGITQELNKDFVKRFVYGIQLPPSSKHIDLSSTIQFHGYKGFFNMCLPQYINVSTPDSIIEDYHKVIGDGKESIINSKILNLLRDSTIVVDEMQSLYSREGLNTYGVVMGLIARVASKYNISITYLSGTPFNTSTLEAIDFINIIGYDVTKPCKTSDREHPQPMLREFLDRNSYVDMVNVNKSVIEKLNSVGRSYIKELRYNVLNHLDQSESSLKTFKTIKSLNEDCSLALPNVDSVMKSIGEIDSLQMIVSDDNKLPTVIFMGNEIIKSTNSKNSVNDNIVIYHVYARGEQRKALLTSSDIEDGEDESSTKLNERDGVLPHPSQYRIVNGAYVGDFLDKDKLGDYSISGLTCYQLSLYNALHNEKTVFYHNKLNNFGLYQFEAILEYNGFTRHGQYPEGKSLCKRCGYTMNDHKKPIMKNIYGDNVNEHSFTPIYFATISGQLDEREKVTLTDIYNGRGDNPSNLYGDIISVLFISDVANVGISFYNTTNLVILTRVPNMSRVKQIYSRIVRNKSHFGLPLNKRYAKVMILAPSADKSDEVISQYYYVSLMRSIFINDIINNEMDYNNLSEFKDNLVYYAYRQFNAYMFDPVYIYSKSNEMKLSVVKALCPTNMKLYDIDKKYDEVYLLSDNVVSKVNYDYDETKTICFSKFSDVHQSKHVDILVSKLEGLTSVRTIWNITDKIVNALLHVKDLSSIKSITPVWDIHYDQHNEWYEDDLTNFIENHKTANRSRSKMKGIYYGTKILKSDGTFTSYQTTNVVRRSKIILYISTIRTRLAKVGYLYAGIIDLRQVNLETNDLRHVQLGHECNSRVEKRLNDILRLPEDKFEKDYFFRWMISYLCDQYTIIKEGDYEFGGFKTNGLTIQVLTPFERLVEPDA